jgi:hypothetical protein
MQVFRDMSRAAEFYPPELMLKDLLAGAPQEEIDDLGRRALQFTADPPFEKLDRDARLQAVAWETFVVDLFRAYQETALREVGPAPIIGSEKSSMPELWI